MEPKSEILLSTLIASIPRGVVITHRPTGYNLDIPVTGIALDSRKVEPGNIFVALRGEHSDGHRFIPQAIQRGAVAIVGTENDPNFSIPFFMVSDARLALAYLSTAFYRFPAHQMTIIGITGTDGKTTTAHLIYQILVKSGLKAGMITTVNAVLGDEIVDTGFHVTTPEAPDIQKFLAWMAYNPSYSARYIVLESTSHGLDQDRVSQCEFDIGVITNITHEHLDYHKSFEAYRDAKARLFKHLAATPTKTQGNVRLAVLNRDDASYEYLSTLVDKLAPKVQRVSYGFHHHADIRAENIRYIQGYQQFEIVQGKERIEVQTRLLGSHNVSNCLAAYTTTVAGVGIKPSFAKEGLETLPSIPGRLESIEMGQNFIAMVDFAHTPNALKKILELTRTLVKGRVLVIFGSAGLRDREKRRMMAEIAAQMADITILTAEDPRTESVDDILNEMALGLEKFNGREGKTYWRIPDRREAIRMGVNLAREDDLVIALGKGHEQSMCFGEIEYPWDDRVAMRAALAERLGIQGPAMPYLPG
jgi:UDP-N-acetylmuramoyl-L-alanyl-D-glutamate--2,6-diaminopimelate ligase